jgi:hypothetical protein
MTEASIQNAELAIVLPLGVVANQLLKIEADLRFLNMKALNFQQAQQGGEINRQIAARIEAINHALSLIGGLMRDIEADSIYRKPSPNRDD